MAICFFAQLLWPVLLFGAEPVAELQSPRPLSLHENRNPNMRYEALEGPYEVYENRAAGSGRKIALHFLVIPAKHPPPQPSPVLVPDGRPV